MLQARHTDHNFQCAREIYYREQSRTKERGGRPAIYIVAKNLALGYPATAVNACV